jgi:iron complex outermembrane receptor protein
MTFPYGMVSLIGNPDLESEELAAHEIGYRINYKDFLALDVTAFYNEYDNLEVEELLPLILELEPFPPHVLVPFRAANSKSARSKGLEVALDWKPSERTRLNVAYAYLEIDTRLEPQDERITIETATPNNPTNQFSLHYSMNVTEDLEFDAVIRYVDEISVVDIDDYTNLDLRLAWQPKEDLEFTLVGRNLLHDQNGEFKSDFIQGIPTEIERSVYGQVQWKF